MKYSKLGSSDLEVSRICLGTMTYGEQNTEQEGHQQLDYALEQGVNFIDTAELYAIPPRAETYGETERIVGSWLKRRGRRDDIVLASKIAGPGPDWVSHIRGGHTRFDADNISQALDESLRRLQTDYIDLYQLHWPERKTNYFGKLGYQADDAEAELTPVYETLQALDKAVQAGKIRYIGLSNETPWGIMQFIWTAKVLNLPSLVTVQNPYSLLNRTYEVGCAEISHREQVGLMAYSPLGFGVLTGKYLDAAPSDARLTRWPHYARYSNEQAVAATRKYVELARRHNLDPAQMALAYVNSRPFLTANIIGATDMQQLKNNIASIELELSETLLDEIEAIHRQHPNPSP
ncbi:NADP(H)-dependent aldo-keto reductase [Methylophaga sp. OBS1]|uniref:NADP(H)-dependent aldo-keto reductase n=1 Tax=Methylophaga sp. OBS1 TaxID=2991933 RepID=UPI0022525C52|nr:NADP(H)-dependent aldo-keto reductase [Methylophaga sp. OBS1]MCX4190868.1 NADP(H)-dependent aldo-keto reductase [Methylophaga sp. OBS1]MCX4192185.1 NADP(H)-dependent aldo-keto reductase [Methylophaga sp. OBS1]